MTDETETKPRRPSKPRAPKWKVRKVDLNQPDHAGVNLTEFTSEGPARKYIRENYPRGREVFLENPDGSREHYSADLHHQEDEPWTEFHQDETEL